MPEYWRLLAALDRQDTSTVRAWIADPRTSPRVREFLSTWLRHARGLQVAAAACRQEVHQAQVG